MPKTYRQKRWANVKGTNPKRLTVENKKMIPCSVPSLVSENVGREY
jgi:hypothetical protein